MNKTKFTIYVRNEPQPFYIWAWNQREAIIILTAKLLELGRKAEILEINGRTDFNVNIHVGKII